MGTAKRRPSRTRRIDVTQGVTQGTVPFCHVPVSLLTGVRQDLPTGPPDCVMYEVWHQIVYMFIAGLCDKKEPSPLSHTRERNRPLCHTPVSVLNFYAGWANSANMCLKWTFLFSVSKLERYSGGKCK